MPTGRRPWAHAIAAFGGLGLLLSLWLPWYSFQIPAGVLNQAEQAGSQFGALAPLIQRGADLLRQLGPQHLTAWDVFHQIDVALAVAAVLAAALAALALTGRATGVSAVIAVAGGVAASLILYRLLKPPGPSEILHPAWGLWFALAGAGAIVVGGLLSRAEGGDDVVAVDFAAARDVAGRPTAGSVAPPGA
ncbi:MAG TPA: hypothetical protein VNR66_14030 [Solirubrobacteraceae bacterium]|nr:hypothetical protein [Solirubrobacteraceae bacterium]